MTNNQLAKWTVAVVVALLVIPLVWAFTMWATGAGMSGGMMSGMRGMLGGGMGGMMAIGWIWMILVPVLLVVLIGLLIRGVTRT